METECSFCGEILLYGKGKSEKFWCPKCEGVELEPINVSQEAFKKDIEKGIQEAKKIINKYDLSSLLISVYITREGGLYGKGIDFGWFMANSELLTFLANYKKGGNKIVEPKNTDFQTLIRIFRDISITKKMMILLKKGFIRTIKIKQKEIPRFAFDLESSIAVDYSPDIKFEDERKISLMKFTSEWKSIKNLLADNGFLPSTQILNGQQKRFDKFKLNEFWFSINTKVGLELSAGDFQILKFPNLKDCLKYITVLEKIVKNFPFTFKYKKERYFGHFSCEMRPVNIVKILYLFLEEGLDIKFFMDNFVATFGECKGFPIFLLTREGLFAGPRTILIATRHLKAKYYRSYLEKNQDIGKEFEQYVVQKLEKSNFSLNMPKDCTNKMINIKDDEKNPTLEIDIVAEYKNNLFVIDCKGIVLTTDYLTKTREQLVKKRLKEEDIKQQRRIAYIKNKFREYGYSSKIKCIHNVIITLNKEPQAQFNDIKIVSVDEISFLKKLVI